MGAAFVALLVLGQTALHVYRTVRREKLIAASLRGAASYDMATNDAAMHLQEAEDLTARRFA